MSDGPESMTQKQNKICYVPRAYGLEEHLDAIKPTKNYYEKKSQLNRDQHERFLRYTITVIPNIFFFTVKQEKEERTPDHVGGTHGRH